MKHKLNLILVAGMLAGFVTPAPKIVRGSPSSPIAAVAAENSGQPGPQAADDLPGWPMPDKPIPHHDPGQRSDAINYTSQVDIVNAMGASETVPLSGLDAMAADGIDPLAGNYNLVSLDNVLRSASFGSEYGMETFSISDTIDLLPGSHMNFGNYPANDIAAGDLNNDGQAEQILAFLDSSNHVNLSVGELPGHFGKSTSAPAAVAQGEIGEIHLLVRGYDYGLWRCAYDIDLNECIWDKTSGGGVLLSAFQRQQLGWLAKPGWISGFRTGGDHAG